MPWIDSDSKLQSLWYHNVVRMISSWYHHDIMVVPYTVTFDTQYTVTFDFVCFPLWVEGSPGTGILALIRRRRSDETNIQGKHKTNIQGNNTAVEGKNSLIHNIRLTLVFKFFLLGWGFPGNRISGVNKMNARWWIICKLYI